MEGYSVFKTNCKLYIQLTLHIQMQLKILCYCLHFHFCECKVTATFQIERQSPFVTIFHISYELSLSIQIDILITTPAFSLCVAHVTCHNSNRITHFSLAFEFPMPYGNLSISVTYYEVYVYLEVTHVYWLVSKCRPSTMIMLNFWQWPCPWS